MVDKIPEYFCKDCGWVKGGTLCSHMGKMDKFEKMSHVTYANGTEGTVEEFQKTHYDNQPIEIWRNSRYQVIKRLDSKVIWLSIKRLDKESIHDWRELQEIKNLLVGPENKGIELYPAESRKVDTSNQYHLWVFADPKIRIPFGFKERLVSGEEEAEKIGAKQRPF